MGIMTEGSWRGYVQINGSSKTGVNENREVRMMDKNGNRKGKG
jgi:hypothetical protein